MLALTAIIESARVCPGLMRCDSLQKRLYLSVKVYAVFIIIISVKLLRRPLLWLSGAVQYMHVHKKLGVTC